MAAAAKQRVREFLDEQTKRTNVLRNKGVSMISPGAKAGETILRLLNTKCCTQWRPETFEYLAGRSAQAAMCHSEAKEWAKKVVKVHTKRQRQDQQRARFSEQSRRRGGTGKQGGVRVGGSRAARAAAEASLGSRDEKLEQNVLAVRKLQQAAQRVLTRRKHMADTRIHQATSAAWKDALKKGNPGVSPKLWSSAASAVRKALRTEQCQVSLPLTIMRNFIAREAKAMK